MPEERSRTQPARLADLAYRLHRWRLRSVTLAHVFAGQTRTPISLGDFEAYMTFMANSLQDLQFVVWFHDYAARFFALPHEQQLQCPGPCSEVFKEKWCDYSRYGASFASVNASGRRFDATLVGTPNETPAALGIEKPRPTPPPHQQSPGLASEPCRILQRLRSFSSSRSGRPTVVENDFLLSKDSDSLGVSCGPGCLCKQPFRDECMHVVKTFLKPGSHKQLNVEPELILDTIRQLAESTHPVVFAKLYDRVYEELERVHLPQFMTMATMNVTLKQQLSWHFLGTLMLAISLGIALATILAVPQTSPSIRAWRSFAVPPFTASMLSFYAAWSGVCPLFSAQGRTALHPWEMEEGDHNTRCCVAAIGKTGQCPMHGVAAPSAVHTRSHRIGSAGHASSASVSTFISESDSALLPPPTGRHDTDIIQLKIQHPSSGHLPSQWYDSSASALDMPSRSGLPPQQLSDTMLLSDAESGGNLRNGFKRNPIFGPNRIVRDARIRAVQRKAMIDSCAFSVFSTLLFCAILYAVPSLRQR